ncbi:MAG TPA: tetratricopeptide repeat protein [Syntrophales bacterium]|nr:tetratricopeptide repeat protein [Syntrophales bacterium]
MRRLFVCFILIFLFAVYGCGWNRSLYHDVKVLGNEEAINYNANGKDLASQDKHKEAIKEFKKAVALDPFYSEAFLNMSKSYYALDDMEYAHFYNIKYFETDQYRDYMYEYRLDYRAINW